VDNKKSAKIRESINNEEKKGNIVLADKLRRISNTHAKIAEKDINALYERMPVNKRNNEQRIVGLLAEEAKYHKKNESNIRGKEQKANITILEIDTPDNKKSKITKFFRRSTKKRNIKIREQQTVINAKMSLESQGRHNFSSLIDDESD